MDGIKETYKSIPLAIRLVILGLLALSPAACEFIEQSAILAEDLARVEKSLTIANTKLARAVQQREKLPAMEEKLRKTVAELEAASAQLPNEFVMDQVLEQTAIYASEAGVVLKAFDPGEEIPFTDRAYKFVTMAINLNIVGRYGEIISFFDRLIHSELLIYLQDFKFTLFGEKKADTGPNGASKEATLARKKLERDSAKIHVLVNMVIFRSLSDKEDAAIDEELKRLKGDET